MWIVTEEAPSRPTVSDMVSFNVDPQWCGLLFSIYCRHEKASFTGGFPSPDALANCAFQGPPLDADWLALAGTLGFEICRLSDTWALVFESVKATSVIFLLGVGGLVCYKLYHYYWPRPRSPTDSPGPSSPRTRRKIFTARALGLHADNDQQLLEPGDEPQYGSVQTRYFGPSNSMYEDDSNEGNSYLADQSASTSPSEDSAEDEIHETNMSEGGLAEKSIHSLRRQRHPWSTPQHTRHDHRSSSLASNGRGWNWRRARHAPSSPLTARDQPRTMPTDNPGWLLKRIGSVVSPVNNQTLPVRKGASLPTTPGRRNRTVPEPRKVQTACQFAEWQQKGRQAPEGAESTVRCRSIPRSDPPDAKVCTAAKINRDISLDSLGFSDGGSCCSGYDNTSRRFPREGSFDSTCSELSIDFSLKETMDTATMACMEQLQKEIDQLKTNCLMMDEDFETIKCNRNVPGMSSLMKASDHNGQVNDMQDSVTENDPVKAEETARACFAGLYSLTTIKNSTSSELSDSALISYRHGSIGSAESLEWDSPKGNTPVKSALNDTLVSPVHNKKEELDDTICEHKINPNNIEVSTPLIVLDRRERSISTQPSSDVLALSEDELMANLEWDNEDLTEYPDISGDLTADGEPNLLACVDTLEMDLETELALKDEGTPRNRSEEPESALDSFTSTSTSRSCTASPTTERSLGEGSASLNTSMVVGTTVKPEQKHLLSLPALDQAKPWTQWSSEESGFMEWDIITESQKPSSNDTTNVFPYSWADLSSPTVSGVSSSEQVTPDSEAVADLLSPCTPSMEEEASSIATSSKQMNVGHRAKLMQYAMKEWQGHTRRAETILKGYAEIPTMLGLEHIRPIRGDNYCAVRATIFQSLVQGVPVPSGQATFSRLSHAIDSGSQWIQDWQFANRLPYCGNNVLHGMRVCLESLDNMASLLVKTGDRETTLAHMLNSDSGLDLHMVEAVKLHMLACAMQLYDANCTGSQDVPLFAVLMFARDTSETPRDLMNNHLQAVGNTGGLEQVEMFLLGYALGVTVRVVRPMAYGTEDFVCNFPDWNEDKWPQVVLIAEDDRHYNVLL